MLKKLLIAIAVIVVVLVSVVAMQPPTYVVSRTISIAAQLPDAYGLVNDFHKWDSWSPWATLDPGMKVTYEGRSSGSGAGYYWTGNDKVGEGRMTILESTGQQIRIKLEFIKPFAQTSITEFAFSDTANTTSVTWAMKGENSFVDKGVCLFMGGMDKMIGPDFERGLAQLKTVTEAATRK
jgi:hypothetical protein